MCIEYLYKWCPPETKHRVDFQDYKCAFSNMIAPLDSLYVSAHPHPLTPMPMTVEPSPFLPLGSCPLLMTNSNAARHWLEVLKQSTSSSWQEDGMGRQIPQSCTIAWHRGCTSHPKLVSSLLSLNLANLWAAFGVRCFGRCQSLWGNKWDAF